MSDAGSSGSGSTPSHHLAAVWFADLVGYTALSETNEGEALRAVGRFQTIVRAAAFRVLDTLASISADLSSATLRLNPIYDSLRDDPRYPELLEKLEAAERSGTGTL